MRRISGFWNTYSVKNGVRLPAPLTEELACYRKHLLRDFPFKVGRFLAVRVNAVRLFYVSCKVLLLVLPRVQELRRRGREGNDHDRFPAHEIGIGNSRVERVPFQAVVRALQLNTRASGFGKVLQYVIRAVRGDGVIYSYAPPVPHDMEVLHYHITSSQLMTFPLPMQSA